MIVLPYPVSANRYWRNFRGRMVRSAAAVAYREEVAEIATRHCVTLHDGPVRVTLRLLPPMPQDWAKRLKKLGPCESVLGLRRLDLDNAMKVALDALQGVAYHNDKQITTLSVGLGMAVPDGGVSATVEDDALWRKEIESEVPFR